MSSIINNSMKTCPKCNTTHSKPGTYCSRTCANSRVWTDADKAIKALAFINSTKTIKASTISKICDCGTAFDTKPYHKATYCSRECSSKYQRKAPGGYRQNSGRSKSGYYKGIYCGSTYELCWVIHSLDHGIEFTRFNGLLEKDGLKYYPDFLLADGKTIIETKGFEKQESVDKKTALAESFSYIVKVLRKDNLQYAFDYVKEKYSTIEYYTLYDGYKPKYSYVCSCCSTEFSRDKKLKTDVVFCSRTCAGKGHKGRVKVSIDYVG